MPVDAPQPENPADDRILAAFLHAYRHGAFPMADPPSRAALRRDLTSEGRIRWYCPDPRAVLPLHDEALHIPRSLARTLRRPCFHLTSDLCFELVIRACAEPAPRRGESWLNETLIRCYTLLHLHGHAHSLEVWTVGDSPLLVGGIYGVSIGRAFFAESMFSRPALGGTDASKVALVALWNHLRSCGFQLLDVQVANPHTLRFGVVEIPADEYMRRLAPVVDHTDAWKPL